MRCRAKLMEGVGAEQQPPSETSAEWAEMELAFF